VSLIETCVLFLYSLFLEVEHNGAYSLHWHGYLFCSVLILEFRVCCNFGIHNAAACIIALGRASVFYLVRLNFSVGNWLLCLHGDQCC
jgi:hypothetical protein